MEELFTKKEGEGEGGWERERGGGEGGKGGGIRIYGEESAHGVYSVRVVVVGGGWCVYIDSLVIWVWSKLLAA